MTKVNVCVALDLINKAIENEKIGVNIYKDLYDIKNIEFGFGNSFLYFKNDAEKRIQRLEGLNRRLTDLKGRKGLYCEGIKK